MDNFFTLLLAYLAFTILYYYICREFQHVRSLV